MNNTLLHYIKTLIETTKLKFVFSILLMLILGFTEGMGLLMLVPILGLVGINTQGGSVGQLEKIVLLVFNNLGIQLTLISVLIVYTIFVTINALLNRQEIILNTSLVNDFIFSLRDKLYRSITNSNWIFISRSKLSNFSHLLTNEIERIALGTTFLLRLLVDMVNCFIYFLLALKLSALMTVIVAVSGIVLLVISKRKIKESQVLGEELTCKTRNLYNAVSEHLSSIKTTKGYNNENKNINIFNDISGQLTKLFNKTVSMQTNIRLYFEISAVLILSLILYFSLSVFNFVAAEVVLLIFLFARIIPRISNIQHNYHLVANMLPAFDNLTKTQINCEKASESQNKKLEPIKIKDSIKLENISFEYEKNNPVIRNLNIKIQKGEFTAITGPSGSGKTTIADLIMGLLSPQVGSILIDNLPLTPERLESWRNQIGYVAQDTFLFHDTIKANLLWAYPCATETELNKALEQAAALSFISELPNGLETIIGDRGVLLSGGERQRLSLARALLRKPSLLILDEATSSLDSENEKRIQNAIEKLHGQMTILVISHRLSTIKNADVIYVLEKGEIVNSGDWDTLASKKDGIFYKLCLAQELDVKENVTLGSGL